MDSTPTVPLSATLGAQPSPFSPPLSPSDSLLIRAPLSSDDADTHSDADSLTTASDEFETASDPDDASLEGSDVAAAAARGTLLPRRPGMPIAQLTGDDDAVEGEVFEEGLADETDGDGDGDGLPAVASVPPAGQNPDFVDEVLDGETDDPSPETGLPADVGGAVKPESLIGVLGENPNPVEVSKDGVLGVEEKETAEPEIPPENTDEDVGGAENPNPVESSKDGVLGIEEKETAEAEDLPENPNMYKTAGTESAESAASGIRVVDGVLENGAHDAKDEILGGGSEEEARIPVVEGDGADEAELDHDEANKDGAVEGAEEPKHGGVEVVGPRIDTADGADSNQNLERGGEVIAGVEEAEKDESLDGPASVDPKIAEDSDVKLGLVHDSGATDRSDSPFQEIGGEKVLIESEQASIDLEAEANLPRPESVVDGDSVAVQEVESQPNLAEVSRTRDVNFGVVSDLEGKPVAEAPHVGDDDDEMMDPIATEEEEGVDLVSDGPARVAILDSSETAKQIIKELEEGSSSTSTHSGFGSSRDYSHNLDGQIASDSDEELLDTDEEGDGKELFDSAALAALLKAATGASSEGSITISSSDASRIFSVDRPAGLGSSVPSLKPAPPRSALRSSLFSPSDLAVPGEPENMDEEERKLHEKVELIRVKFLRLVQRLGHSPEDTVAAQVLYRLGLAEGIRRGRQTSRAFSLENARKKALELEMDKQDDLDFSCNILVLGRTGVGKSATINSVFGEEKSGTSAFERGTASVKEIVGIVDGVKIRVIDTPGLRASMRDQTSNKRILSSIKKYTKRYPPDIVLYVDRMDIQTRDFNDLPMLRCITSALGSTIWFNAIVALTHAASAPPDGPNGYPLSYDMFVAQRSHVVQHSIRQAAGDMRLMNPVALVENHPSCRRNREGERVLPNGQSWRSQMLLLCYSSKILSEANSLLKLQDSSPGKLFGFRTRSPPLPFLLSSLLQSRSHPKLSADQGGENGDSDVDLDDLSDADQEEEEDEYDELPPFKPLRKSQIAKLTKEQKKAYFDEYDYRVKLLQKKQWKEELKRMKEMKKKGKGGQDDFVYGDMAEDFDQDNVPAAVPVPLPDMVLPPSFDGDYPAHRYRFLEPTSQLLIRPVLDSHGWDHDCGYDGVSLEQNLAVLGHLPAGLSVQVTKDKKEFNVHLDSSISAKHGENGSSLAGFDIQSIGKQLAYILRGETKFKNLKKNKTAAGISITFLGETLATGLKIEDQVSIGKRLSMGASTGVVRAQGDMAYGANLEARLRDKDYPIGQTLSTLGLSLMRWRGDLALGANLQSQFSLGRNSKMAVRVGLNNKLSGQITVRTSSSENLQIALVGILPIATSIYRSIWPGESIPY